MPNRRFDWHEHIKDVEGEYKAARIAVDRLKAARRRRRRTFSRRTTRRAHTSATRTGTSKGRTWFASSPPSRRRSAHTTGHSTPIRRDNEDASVLIDKIGGRRGQGISAAVREGAQAVRRVRNYWAHENDETPEPMTIAEAQARLQTYLSWLPKEWG